MQLKQPDPGYISSARAKHNFKLAVILALVMLAIVWFVFLLDNLFDLRLNRFGLRPRQLPGLIGVLTTPLLHSGLSHILHNSGPLLVGSIAMLYLYPNSAMKALPWLYAGTSVLAWTFGSPNIHIGASGMIYGILAFVFMSGLLRRDMRSVTVSLLIWFLYGSMLSGLFPTREGMSWELHLSGAIVGVLAAWILRRQDQVPLKRYDWEDSDEDPEWYREAEEASRRRHEAGKEQDSDSSNRLG